MGSSLCLPQSLAAKKPVKSVKGKNVDIHIASGKDSLRHTYFSVGLLAVPRHLDGVGVNVVGTIVQHRMHGVQASGLLNVTGDNAYGLQVAGITNVTGEEAYGVQVGGLMNVTNEGIHGLQVSGLANVNSVNADGVVVSGLMNVTGRNANGLVVSGLANVSGSHANGLHVSGLMNVAGDRMQGMQVSSLLNVSGNRTRGLQVAGLCNVSYRISGGQIAAANLCPTRARGFQVGAFNWAKMLQGFQAGVVNDCDSVGHGLQLGVVNYSASRQVTQLGLVNLHPDTRIQWMVYGGNVGKINTAARFLNRHTYTILGLGTHYAGLDKGFSAGLTYRAGLHQPLGSRLRLSEDAGYVHVENFDAKSECIPSRMYALQGRVNLECAVARRCALFVSGGYSWMRRYGQGANIGHKPLCEWGIILF
jgi:hypothetical protein